MLKQKFVRHGYKYIFCPDNPDNMEDQVLTFSKGDPSETMAAFMGKGGSLLYKFTIKLFGWEIVFWKKPPARK